MDVKVPGSKSIVFKSPDNKKAEDREDARMLYFQQLSIHMDK
jgi:hypothetical protein